MVPARHGGPAVIGEAPKLTPLRSEKRHGVDAFMDTVSSMGEYQFSGKPRAARNGVRDRTRCAACAAQASQTLSGTRVWPSTAAIGQRLASPLCSA